MTDKMIPITTSSPVTSRPLWAHHIGIYPIFGPHCGLPAYVKSWNSICRLRGSTAGVPWQLRGWAGAVEEPSG